MKPLYPARLLLLFFLLAACWLAPGTAGAQAPPWGLALTDPLSIAPNQSTITGMAPDAGGNLLVAGYFTGQVSFGSTTLVSRGLADWFVAKYVPASATWEWALRGGGTDEDRATGIAVSGSTIYLTGVLNNDRANHQVVQVDTDSNSPGFVTQLGVGPTPGTDVLVASYQDTGAGGALNWVQVAGGNSFDYGTAIAASGSQVYVTGYVRNSSANAQAVVLGGSGLAAGTVPLAGASATTSVDMLLAKYQDNGPSASVVWAQVAGGTGTDAGLAVAVAGTSVYVTGYALNDRANSNAVVFGGSALAAGTQAQAGATATVSQDLVLAKYLDAGASATVAWTQVAGGRGDDQGNALAVSGSSVYVAGTLTNDRANTDGVVLGGSGLTAGTRPQYGASAVSSLDALVVKYQDAGATAAVQWTQAAGGTGPDVALAVAVAGSSVYVAGSATNDDVNSRAVVLGGSGTAAGTLARPGASLSVSADVLVARYRDQGTSAAAEWAQVGGGPRADAAAGLALVGPQLYVAGLTTPLADFGLFALGNPTKNYFNTFLLAALDLSNFLATTSPSARLPLSLYPNPAASAAHLSDAPASTSGQVLDALGRAVATFRTDATGAALLPAGLASGVYVVRVGTAVGQLVVP